MPGPSRTSALSNKSRGVILESRGLPGLHRATVVKSTPYTVAKERLRLQKKKAERFKGLSPMNRQLLEEAGIEIPNESNHDGWGGGEDDGEDIWVDEDVPAGMSLKGFGTDLHDGLLTIHHLEEQPCKYRDSRTRRDRLERENEAWRQQRAAMADALMLWEARRKNGNETKDAQALGNLSEDGGMEIGGDEATGGGIMDRTMEDRDREGGGGGDGNTSEPAIYHPPLPVYEFDGLGTVSLKVDKQDAFVVTLVKNGFMGTSAVHPEAAVSIQVLEVMRILTSRCPQVSIQVMAKTLSTIGNIAYRPYLRRKLSTAYYAYLGLREEIDNRIRVALKHNTPNYEVEHACAPCTYTVSGEPALKYDMQITMDGNNSLKRVPRRRYDRDEAGKVSRSTNIERETGKYLMSDMYLSKEVVDEFQYEVKGRKAAGKQNKSERDWEALPGDSDGNSEPVPCVDTWKNLAADEKKKLGSFFEETGAFVMVCRHGMVLLMCDMIQSGELAKYPLALLGKALDVFKCKSFLVGYDIGCGFSATVGSSEKIGERFRESASRFCVGSFHGHAHARKCQLDWHPLYLEGAGLEDFEGCERVFSCTNKLARTTRLAAVFTRRELILRFVRTWNSDRYLESSRFLYNNFRQAHQILSTHQKLLEDSMELLGLESAAAFAQWRQDEKNYLQTTQEVPIKDLLQMSYVDTLKKLAEAQMKFESTSREFINVPMEQLSQDDSYRSLSSQTIQRETSRQNSLESLLTLQKAVEDIENRLEVDKRWVMGDENWERAAEKIALRDFQKACDKLEGLVVARCMEFTKQHQSETGVKLRDQIGNGIRSRHPAIRNALVEYNKRATEVQPPRPQIDIKEVIEFTQVGQFVFLRDSRYDILNQPWAQPLGRRAMDIWYKMERAKEECSRVRIEATRLVTYILYEEKAICDCIHDLLDTGSYHLARQLERRLNLFTSENTYHFEVLGKLEALSGFGSSIRAGVPSELDVGSASIDSNRRNASDVESMDGPDGAGVGEVDSDDDNILEDLNLALDAMQCSD